MVILADTDPAWKPCEHHFELAGFESRLRFPICKVLDRLDTDWANDTSLPAQLARAQIAALRTSGNPESRFIAKTELVRSLYKAGYNADELREAFRLIDWMMHLRLDLSRRFEIELTAYEKESDMPYVTSVEKIAEERGVEKGIEKGRDEGNAALLLRILIRVCGPLPDEVRDEVRRLSLEQRGNLGEASVDFQSLDDLKIWLTTVSQFRPLDME